MTTTTAKKRSAPRYPGPSAHRARQPRRDSRKAIIDAAVDLFSRSPYEEVSVDDLCERAGVAHGLISYHFGGKNGVFSAAVIETWREIIEFERPREDEVGAAARIYGSLCRHFEQVRADPRRMRLLRAGSREEEVRQFVKAARHEAVLELTAYLGCPLHPPAKLRAALFGWSGYLDGVTLDWEENEDLDLDFVTGLCVQSLVTAVRSASGLSYDPVTEIAALELVSGPPRSPARDAI